MLYTCCACNLTRGNQPLPNPLDHLLSSTVEVKANGQILAHTTPAEEIAELLHLNDPEYIFRRGQMIAMLNELERRRFDLFRVWLGYPD